MRKMMLVIGMAALAGCSGISKEQYGAKEAEASKYKAALADETGKVAALEAKTKSLTQENAALQTKSADLEKQLAATSEAKSNLEVTTAKLTEQSGEYAKMNKELQSKLTIKLSDRLLFAENSSKLTAESKRALDGIADAVGQLKDKNILVAGFTDDAESGGKSGQVKRWQLSTNRALEIAKYLVGRGVDAGRIGVAGFGEARPLAPNDSMANRALNRRVEIALSPADLKMKTVDVKPAKLETK